MIFLNCSIIIDVHQQKTVCSVTKWCHPFHSSGGAIITGVTLYTSHYRVVHPALDTRHSQTCKRCFTQFDTVVQYLRIRCPDLGGDILFKCPFKIVSLWIIDYGFQCETLHNRQFIKNLELVIHCARSSNIGCMSGQSTSLHICT